MPTLGLIIPSETYRAEAFLAATERMGLDVVTISDVGQAFAEQMGDHFLQVPLDHPVLAAAKIIKLAGQVPLDGIVAVDDAGALTASYAASRLGLRHNDPTAMRATRDKSVMRERLFSSGVRQPEYLSARVDDDEFLETHVAGLADELGYPVVIKPCSLSGSRGVIRADDHTQARAAARRVREIATAAGENPYAPMLVERFIAGDEVAFEGHLRAGALSRLAIFDKPDPLNGPFFEETIYVTPSGLENHIQDEIETLVASACAALGLTEGPIHAEVRITPDTGNGREVVFLELAARTIGGRCAKAIQFEDGTMIEQIVLSDALGLDTTHVRQAPGASGVMMLPIPNGGRLAKIDGQDRARAIPHIDGCEITIPIGRMVKALPEGDRYLGFLFASATTPEEVVVALRSAKDALDIEIELSTQ